MISTLFSFLKLVFPKINDKIGESQKLRRSGIHDQCIRNKKPKKKIRDRR
jgi:hypothetical protein